ncbi:hypothetical protein QUF99_22795 [Bacillus sp. DX4.1]|uniref:hypothetical protein n=1 Tax=Bacillus sp. DX4.1 TaxID=3055867 RepID=UPI0025A1B82D|nr:hypothetical protein [Bacillus sp. DX4.1]MDM5190055.1 hypothetical protein [Bacillus sp. DX4.1]
MQQFIKKLGVFAAFGLLLVGCQSEQESQEKDINNKVIAHQEAKINVTKEDEQAIRTVIETFIQTTNEKNFEQHMALFSTKIVGAEDLRTQKEAEFQRENRKVELNNIQVKNVKESYVVAETEEKETRNGESLQKKVRYALGKEDENWKIEEVRVIEKK